MKTITCLLIPALVGVLCSCQTGGGATSTVGGYYDFLNGLPKSDPDSIHIAVECFQEHLRDLPQNQRDAAFLAFREFYFSTFGPVWEKLDKQLEEHMEKSMADYYAALTAPPLLRTLEKNGLVPYGSEGSFFIGEPDGFLLATFRSYVSKPLSAFLKLRQAELKEGYSEDAALTIPFSNVAQRCLNWEHYLDDFPKSPLRDDAENRYRDYLTTLLEGMDNIPVLDNENENAPMWIFEIKETYRDLMANHATTKTGRFVAEYFPLVTKARFKRTPEVARFLEAHKADYSLENAPSYVGDFGAPVTRERKNEKEPGAE